MKISILTGFSLCVLMVGCGGSSGSSSTSSSSNVSLPGISSSTSSVISSLISSASSVVHSEPASSLSSAVESSTVNSMPSSEQHSSSQVLSSASFSSEHSSGEQSSHEQSSSAQFSSAELSSESSSEQSSSAPVALGCAATANVYFCEDFSSGSDSWSLKPVSGPNGEFSILGEGDTAALRYTAAASGATGGVIALVKPAAFAGITSADYYVEARIRPRLNSSGTAQRSIYVMARYQDEQNWYGMGMIAHESNQPRVEIVERNGTGNPASTGGMRYSTAITLGDSGANNGEWYTLRLELIGSEMKLYFNGVAVASHSDARLTERGLIGLFTNNRSFEIDDIRVGNAADKPIAPAQLTITPTADYSAEVNDPARVIQVSAITPVNGADTFTVESSNPGVVSVSVAGNNVSLVPVGEGSADITFTSGSDPQLTRSLSATIAPEFVQSATAYNLVDAVHPAAGATDAYADTSLQLIFDEPPVLGSAGSIRIFNTSDDSLVHSIKLFEHKDTIGASTQRSLNTSPIRISGNRVDIALYSKKLAHDTSYYVAISPSVFSGARLAGQAFTGLGKAAGWHFTTRAAPAANLSSITVDDDGAGADFVSLQAALNYAMLNTGTSTPLTIVLKNGTYAEPLYLRNKHNLTIQGESREGAVIAYTNNEGLNSGSSNRALFLVEGSDMLVLENLTLKNTTLSGSEKGQAEAIYFNSPTGRLVAKNAKFISEQDTLLLKGWTWFYDSLVAGTVDFIWGYSKASLFENSEIRSLGRSSGNNNGGYILQARVESQQDKGFVFLNSRLTQGPGPTQALPVAATHYLARSGGCAGCYDNIVFINTRMDSHIRPVGWLAAPLPTPAVASALAGWREYGSMDINGNPLNVSARLANAAYQLSPSELAEGYCSRAHIFAGYNEGAGWNPMPDDSSDCLSGE